MKKAIIYYPQEYSAKRLSYPLVEFEITHAVIQLGLQIHPNMGVYLER